MAKKENIMCYNDITEKFERMETKITQIKDGIRQLKERIYQMREPVDVEEEECLDEIEADVAALEAIHDICIESLFEIEPKGEA
jgi:archaellum component FlaC